MLWREARGVVSAVLAVMLVVQMAFGATVVGAAESDDSQLGATPPRLSYADGDVSYFRPGAQDWAPAEVNTALAPGDELYTGNRGNLELQVGARAFVRAWGDSQLGLVNHAPDFLQLKVTGGHVALDLRTVEAGRTVEVDTPHAAFTIERAGYYRVDVTDTGTSFVTRRSGQATMTPAGGQAVAVAASEEVVLEGAPTSTVRSYVAPELDVWDRWNYARTDDLIDAISSRYVSAGVYGIDDLDHYGDWRVVPTYGAVWVPQSVPAGWAPYSTGRWVLDSYYGWTWVDTAPWGWAPYHYGRWVSVSGYWAWAPGPVVVRPVYAPALVAFFGGASVKVAIGVPGISWVALSWGEPLVPWWGKSQFIGRPTWAGWGGPRVVNNVVVNRTTVVNVTNINVYKNTTVEHAVVAVREDQFGRGSVQQARVAQVDTRRLEPARTPLRMAPDASSYAAGSGRAARPPENTVTRAVVATRAPRREAARRPDSARGEQGPNEAQRANGPRPAVAAPQPRIVPAPKPASTGSAPARPTFGQSEVERQRPPQPRQFGAPGPPDAAPAPRETSAPPSGPAPSAPREVVKPAPQQPAQQQQPQRPPQPQQAQPQQRPQPQHAPRPERVEAGRGAQQPQRLPGEPANRIAPQRAEHRQQPEAPQERRGGGREQPPQTQPQPQQPGR